MRNFEFPIISINIRAFIRFVSFGHVMLYAYCSAEGKHLPPQRTTTEYYTVKQCFTLFVAAIPVRRILYITFGYG
jgi:hypothetical protein